MCAWKLCIWALAFMASVGRFHCVKAAEIASPVDRDSITQQQKTLLEQAQQQREALQNNVALPALPLPVASAGEETCHNVQRIVFQGAEHLSWSVKEKLANPYQGRCLTLNHINRLVRETTNAYLQRGYITSQAFLQDQDIAGGTLIISANEGRVESITLDGENTLALRMAFPGRVDEVLNLRDIEQGMEQLNRLPSQQVSIDILAADKGDVAAAKRVVARREAAAIVATVGGGGLVLAAGGMTLVGVAPELVLAARLAIASCKTNPALCLNQAGIYAADIVAPEAIIGTGAITTGSTLILGKTEDSVKKLTQQLVKTSDELYKTKNFNAQPVADFIKGETAAGTNLSTKTANYLRDIQKVNTDQLVKLFDKTQSDGNVTVFGKPIAQVLGDGGSNRKGTTKVFASESLGDKEIYDYAQSLAGGLPLKEVRNSKGIVYYAKFEGKIINLRNYSTSAQESKARWTIDIIGNKDINKVSNLSDNKFEMKFR
ncbi:POTRA domain-containing protein [Serratia plymuthica]|uniref:POTRA domain-containing protein n=1 Tax=Serratia plymuthica TaxID=82996 RepID=UPI00141A5A1D|nr:POTRA domain-containing protein [Serratia plymuthica]NIC28583.1 DUF769 domain-containing protein [Serratia plymuthica]